jgi:hypothetical protein
MDVVFDRDSIPEIDPTLDSDTGTDHHIVLYEYVITHVAIFANASSPENVGKCPDTRASSYNCPFFHQSVRVDKRLKGEFASREAQRAAPVGCLNRRPERLIRIETALSPD